MEDKKNDLKDQAIKTHIMEDYFRTYGIITPDYLQRVRMMLIVGFNLKLVEIECNLNAFTINVGVKFKFFPILTSSKNKAIAKIKQVMEDNFIQYKIEVTEIKG